MIALLLFVVFSSLTSGKGQPTDDFETGIVQMWNNTHTAHFRDGELLQVGLTDDMAASHRESKINLKLAHSPPRIISQTIDHVLLSGRTKADLICEVKGKSSETVIKWVAKHHDMDDLEVLSPSVNTRILRIPRVSKEHDGNYTCIATNAYGEAQLDFRVKVVETKDGNFEIYVYFVGATLCSLLLVLCCAFCCGRYCCKRSTALRLTRKVTSSGQHAFVARKPENHTKVSADEQQLCVTHF